MSNITLLPAERYESTTKVDLDYSVDKQFIYIPQIKMQIDDSGQITKKNHGSITSKHILVSEDLVKKILRISAQIMTLKNEGHKIATQLFFDESPNQEENVQAERFVSPTLHWRGLGADRQLIYVPKYKVEIEDNGRISEQDYRAKTVIGQGAYKQTMHNNRELPFQKQHEEAKKAADEAEIREKAIKQIYVREDLVKRVVEIRRSLLPLQAKLEENTALLFSKKHTQEESKLPTGQPIG